MLLRRCLRYDAYVIFSPHYIIVDYDAMPPLLLRHFLPRQIVA